MIRQTGGLALGANFDEVEIAFSRHCGGFTRGENAELFARGIVNHADFTGADLFIDSETVAYGMLLNFGSEKNAPIPTARREYNIVNGFVK